MVISIPTSAPITNDMIIQTATPWGLVSNTRKLRATAIWLFRENTSASNTRTSTNRIKRIFCNPAIALALPNADKCPNYRCFNSEMKSLKTLLQTVIHLLTKFLAGLEVRNILCWQLHSLSGFRIPTGTGGAMVKGEATKPPDLDSLSVSKRLGHMLNNCFYRQLNIFNRELRLFRGN